jgi:hypothetical protein
MILLGRDSNGLTCPATTGSEEGEGRRTGVEAPDEDALQAKFCSARQKQQELHLEEDHKMCFPLGFCLHVGWVALTPQHGASSGCGGKDGLQQWNIAANILNKQPRADDKRRSPAWGLGLRLTTHSVTNKHVTEILEEPRTLTDSLRDGISLHKIRNLVCTKCL